MTGAWRPGQSVILDGEVTEVERVTPAGWPVVEGRRFGPDGEERKKHYGWGPRPQLRSATPEAVAELKMRQADEDLCDRFWAALRRLENYGRRELREGSRGLPPNLTPDERAALTTLVSAIDKITDNTPEP